MRHMDEIFWKTRLRYETQGEQRMMKRERIRGVLSFLVMTWLLMGQVAAQEAAPGGEQTKRPETLPEGVHHVRQGDTLWAIGGRYLDNPRLWPQIWKENPFVTDPNRI